MRVFFLFELHLADLTGWVNFHIDHIFIYYIEYIEMR